MNAGEGVISNEISDKALAQWMRKAVQKKAKKEFKELPFKKSTKLEEVNLVGKGVRWE